MIVLYPGNVTGKAVEIIILHLGIAIITEDFGVEAHQNVTNPTVSTSNTKHDFWHILTRTRNVR